MSDTLTSNERVTPVDGLIAESRAVLATHRNGTWKDDYAALRLAQMVRALLARIEEMTAPEPATELSDDFRKGVRAVFDSLLCRAANNYHGNPDVNASCTEENKIVTAWAADALAEVSVDDWNEWVSITDLRRENDELKAQVRAAPPPSDVQQQLDEANAALSFYATMWQPIESAPHNDGFACIVSVPNEGQQPYVGEAHFVDEEGWYWAGNDPTDSWGPGALTPSHWMPLPAPPSSSVTKGGEL